eukprot:6010516-Pleurochrysis_carterae.AAC.1
MHARLLAIRKERYGRSGGHVRAYARDGAGHGAGKLALGITEEHLLSEHGEKLLARAVALPSLETAVE